MKRRRFIGLGLFVIVLTAVVGWFFQRKKEERLAPWWEPDTLGKICSREKLMELGRKYRYLSQEDQQESLTNLLLKDFTGNEKDRQIYIEQHIAEDFQKDRTIMIDGWYLSITEARMCALFSLQEPVN